MSRLVYGVGINNKGKFKASEKGKHLKVYDTWQHMLCRCYSDKYHKKEPTYIGCEVCEDWFYFQNFAKWYYENYYEVDNQRMELDKDILYKGNKIYSPSTCIFVPKEINVLFLKNNSKRGNFPIGIHYHKASKKLIAQCNIGTGNDVYLGLFNNVEEAFAKYKEFKEQYIKQVANKYKGQIPNKLYEAMTQYIVEIND